MKAFIVILMIILGATVAATDVSTLSGDSVTLPCSINAQYPGWKGPNGITINNQGYVTINPNLGDLSSRLSWASDSRSLNINNTRATDEGWYRCVAAGKGDQNVTLHVRGALQTPEISNTVTEDKGRVTVHGTEMASLTLTCISRGGKPEPSVTWHRGSLSSTLLSSTTTSTTTETDSTITVTTRYTFTPRRVDDTIEYFCQAAYRTAPISSVSASVHLHLQLQPSTPTLATINTPVHEGQQNVQIGNCSTSGFRPRGDISMSWTVGGVNVPGTGTIKPDTGGTFSYIGSINKSLTRQDNGQVTCTVNHGTLSTPLSTTKHLNVTFAPLNATLTGNTSIVANGINRVELTCTTSTANPPATISLSRNGSPIDSTYPVQETAGDYGGKITSLVLALTPKRGDDGDVYTCTASNTVNTPPPPPPVTSRQKVLDLKYHPIVTSITGPSNPVTEGQTTNNVFRCTVSSKPTATVTWNHGSTKVHESTSPDSGTVYSYTIPVINRTHAGLYKCVANNSIIPNGQRNISVNVYFAPHSVTLTGNTSILANNINTVTLNCTTTPANPPATFSWSKNGTSIDNSNPIQQTAGDYGGKITSQVLELTPTRDDDGDVYKCTASNTVNTPVTSLQTILDIVYIPTITISKTESDVTECTNRLTLTCTVSSKPVSTTTWYKGQQPLTKTGVNNVRQYIINNVNRTISGQYRCMANNGYGGNVQERVNMTVKYAPDVSVTTRNVTTLDDSVDIVCNASGVPGDYTFAPWTHQWDISGPVLNHPGLGDSPVMKLTNLTYEHSGLYMCNVSNGVDCSKNPDAGTGHVYLVVKAAPVLTDQQPNINNERIPVASKMKSFAVFNFSLWSNADNTTVQCYRNINGTRQNNPVGRTFLTETPVMLPVFSSLINTTGTLASLSLQILHADDFGLYDIVLYNQIGNGTLLAINVVAQGPPQTPVLISVSVLSPTEVSVNWTRSFHGGLDQTIVIQISTDEVHWENKTEVVDGMRNEPETPSIRLQGLSPSSLYYIRMLAYNDEGISDNYTDVLSFTTHSEKHPSSSPDAAVVAGIAGSLVAVIIVVVFLIVLKRRNIIGGKSQDTELVRRQPEESRSQSEDEEIVENMMYVSANEVPSQSTSGQIVDTSAIYSRPVKPGKHVVAGSGDVYAVVSKPKKQGVEETKKVSEMPKKKEKGKKVDKKKGKIAKKSGGGDVYENAPEEATAAANNENIYESTETSPPPKPSRRPNKDGLLYADIEFKSTPSSNGTAVIHGLDDRTLYSDIDFNKEAEPLPESDEENDKPK